jgi:PHD/YefM family antitoxin component YafN of YafNO toxin-antitoxin module
MSVHTFSSRDFTRDVSAAKRAAAAGPVFITDRGRPAFALLKIEDYYHLEGRQTLSLLEVMDAIPGGLADGAGIEFEAPRLQVQLRAAKLG